MIYIYIEVLHIYIPIDARCVYILWNAYNYFRTYIYKYIYIDASYIQMVSVGKIICRGFTKRFHMSIMTPLDYIIIVVEVNIIYPFSSLVEIKG